MEGRFRAACPARQARVGIQIPARSAVESGAAQPAASGSRANSDDDDR